MPATPSRLRASGAAIKHRHALAQRPAHRAGGGPKQRWSRAAHIRAGSGKAVWGTAWRIDATPAHRQNAIAGESNHPTPSIRLAHPLVRCQAQPKASLTQAAPPGAPSAMAPPQAPSPGERPQTSALCIASK
jgi:hypothetical protein